MVDRLIVPVDGSPPSWRAFDVAVRLARRCGGTIDVVQVVADPADVAAAQRDIDRELADRAVADVPIDRLVQRSDDGVAATLATFASHRIGATFVMASHGRGRSAALLGSVAEQLLETTFGPLLVVGPHAEASDFDGSVIVTADGSDVSEAAVPLAVAWSIELRATTWILEVLDPDVSLPSDVADTAYVAGLARRMDALTSHDVEYDILRGRDPVASIVDHAGRLGASMVVAATHGRTGASRLALGSVAAGFVRHATCPVLLVRPPHRPAAPDARNASASGVHA